MAIGNDCDHYELVFCNKVPYASLVLCRFVSWMRLYVEFQSGGKRDGDQVQQTAEPPEYSLHVEVD